jgi:hypothetical protein
MWKDQFKIKIEIKQSKKNFKGLKNEGLNIFPCLLNLVPDLARKKSWTFVTNSNSVSNALF